MRRRELFQGAAAALLTGSARGGLERNPECPGAFHLQGI